MSQFICEQGDPEILKGWVVHVGLPSVCVFSFPVCFITWCHMASSHVLYNITKAKRAI